jgi:hypothetical protein
MPRRLAALLVAVALVAGAIAIRAFVLDDDDGPAAPEGGFQLTCVTELAPVCDAIARADDDVDVTIEPAGETAQRLTDAESAEDIAADGWLTLAPWSEIVAVRREVATTPPVLEDPSSALARSPLVIAVDATRAATLGEACDDDVTWTCIGEIAGRPWSELGGDERWGQVKPAHGSPVDTAGGLLVLGQAVGHYLADPPRVPVEQVSSNDWQASTTFPAWFQRLESAIPADAFTADPSPFERWLQLGLRNYSLVGSYEAEIEPRIERSPALGDDIEVIYPSTVASADVVFAPTRGRSDDLQRIMSSDDVRTAFTAAGWRVGDLGSSDGLPSAGTLDALQAYWLGAVR